MLNSEWHTSNHSNRSRKLPQLLVNHYLEALSVYKGCGVLFHLLLCWNMQVTKSLDPLMPEFNRSEKSY